MIFLILISGSKFRYYIILPTFSSECVAHIYILLPASWFYQRGTVRVLGILNQSECISLKVGVSVKVSVCFRRLPAWLAVAALSISIAIGILELRVCGCLLWGWLLRLTGLF